MPFSTGTDSVTGKPLSDWAHTVQSIHVILTTPIGSRPMRREFGSELPNLIDKPLTSRNILAVYSAVHFAILKWEPRYRVKKVGVVAASAAGYVELSGLGEFYPRGHRGDYSIREERSFEFTLPQIAA